MVLKKRKISTHGNETQDPVRSEEKKEVAHFIERNHDCSFIFQSDEESKTKGDDSKMPTEMTDLLPEVLTNLAQNNKVEDMKRFMKLVAEGNFPMENIAYQ